MTHRIRHRQRLLHQACFLKPFLRVSFCASLLLWLAACSRSSSEPEVGAPPPQPDLTFANPETEAPAAAQPDLQPVQNRRHTYASKTLQGDFMQAPALPSLVQALDFEQPLAYSLRSRALQAAYRENRPDTHLLGDPEINRLKQVLTTATTQSTGLYRSQLDALKNDILNLLILRLSSPRDQASLETLLKTLQADPTHSLVIRDYALQHLASLADQTPQPAAQASRYASHWQSLSSYQQHPTPDNAMLAATSLLHLLDAQQKQRLSSDEQARLETQTLELIQSPDTPSSAKVTALQVGHQLRLAGLPDLAFSLAQDPYASFPLRIAAVAALAQPDMPPQHQHYLEQLVNGPNTRLRHPAQQALASQLPQPPRI